MNVMVIVADTWRFDYLGFHGNDWIRTPNIDRLAAESTVFENAHAEMKFMLSLRASKA